MALGKEFLVKKKSGDKEEGRNSSQIVSGNQGKQVPNKVHQRYKRALQFNLSTCTLYAEQISLLSS
jgi:hypothetical protein